MDIISAQWILPINQAPIWDGAIAFEQDTIVAIGKASKIRKQYKGHDRNLGSTILLPGLVNAHTHLEYSCLKGKIHTKSFMHWVAQMITLKHRLEKKEIKKAAQEAIRELVQTGTTLVADVTNTGHCLTLLIKSGLAGINFHEILGQIHPQEIPFLKRSKSPHSTLYLACHGPHTVSLDTLKSLSETLPKFNRITSIHLAESLEECQWIKTKDGPFGHLLRETKLSKNSFLGKNLTPVEYLKKVGFLSQHVLCVHGVHMDAKDIQILRKSSVPLVLCPRSNEFTGAGIAPVEELVKAGILLCLGTDSLASNTDLNLWNEMKALKKSFPFLTYPFILRMATLNGAKALGFGKTYGSLEPGKKAVFIAVNTGSEKVEDPYRFLVEETHEKIFRHGPPLWANDPLQS